jgi:hypothetical protein
MLAGGVVGLLMFNTNMQQASFKATALQGQVNDLTAREQSLDMELDRLREPQRLASAAKALGMVAPAQPAFIRIGDGRVLGNPTPSSPADAVRINPLPSELPESIKPKTVIAKVPKKLQSTSGTDTPGTSTNVTREGGRKKASTQANSGATR